MKDHTARLKYIHTYTYMLIYHPRNPSVVTSFCASIITTMEQPFDTTLRNVPGRMPRYRRLAPPAAKYLYCCYGIVGCKL